MGREHVLLAASEGDYNPRAKNRNFRDTHAELLRRVDTDLLALQEVSLRTPLAEPPVIAGPLTRQATA